MPAASRQWRGEDAQHIFTAGGAAGWIHHLAASRFGSTGWLAERFSV
jgi:hypothetical protein